MFTWFCISLFCIDLKFVHLLKYRIERTASHHIGDIYDGLIYQEQSKNFFDNPYNISFSLNYNGAQKFKSSIFQIWPIQLFINELPPQLRYLRTSY